MLIIIKLFHTIIKVLEDLVKVAFMLIVMFEWELEHDFSSLDSVDNLKDNEEKQHRTQDEEPRSE
jgi:hypothetical protein